jgi:hypothetical protein
VTFSAGTPEQRMMSILDASDTVRMRSAFRAAAQSAPRAYA